MMSISQSINSDTRPAPKSLEEMSNMSYEDFRRVKKYLPKVHQEKTLQQRINCDTRTVEIKATIEHLIELADNEIDWRGRDQATSIRGFWYKPAKPILKTAFPDTDNLDNRLSSILSTMVKEGEVSYRGLNIVDDSRKRKIYRDSIENDKILFVEKDVAFRKLKPLSEVYNITLVSGGGQPSRACSADIVDQLDSSIEYDIYAMVDYDPSGFKIANTFKTHMEDYGLSIGKFERIALHPEQIDQQTLQENKYIPKGNYNNWYENYAIAGEYGLEIDAIDDINSDGKELRKVAVEGLRPHIRERKRIKKDTKLAEENLTHHAVNGLMNVLVNELESELHREAKKIKREEKITPEPYNPEKLHDSAVNGSLEPSPRTSKAKNRIRNKLEEKISTGEISVEEFLNEI